MKKYLSLENENTHDSFLRFYTMDYIHGNIFSKENVTNKDINFAQALMVLNKRHYGHVVLVDSNQIFSFGLNGVSIKEYIPNKGNANYVDVPITLNDDQRVLLTSDMSNKVFTEVNHLHLLTNGYDLSNQYDVFTCSTWIAYCLGLNKYWTFSADGLFKLLRSS